MVITDDLNTVAFFSKEINQAEKNANPTIPVSARIRIQRFFNIWQVARPVHQLADFDQVHSIRRDGLREPSTGIPQTNPEQGIPVENLPPCLPVDYPFTKLQGIGITVHILQLPEFRREQVCHAWINPAHSISCQSSQTEIEQYQSG